MTCALAQDDVGSSTFHIGGGQIHLDWFVLWHVRTKRHGIGESIGVLIIGCTHLFGSNHIDTHNHFDGESGQWRFCLSDFYRKCYTILAVVDYVFAQHLGFYHRFSFRKDLAERVGLTSGIAYCDDRKK